MPRRPSVWYWEARKAYYTTVNRKKIKLGTNKKVAEARLKRILSELPKIGYQQSSISVTALLTKFIEWDFENRAESTAVRHKEFCDSFAKHVGPLPVSKVNASYVSSWLASKKWNNTTKRNAITVIQRAFNWGVNNDGLTSNPIKGMEKPISTPIRRSMTLDDMNALITIIGDSDPFSMLLRVGFDSGARPKELVRLEARHIDTHKKRAIYPPNEAKGGKIRIIYFPHTFSIIEQLAKEHPEGVLLLNANGNPWTTQSIKCRFDRFYQKTGLRWNTYAMRHGFVNQKLKAGVDSHIVARLAGHVDTTMINKVYSHVEDDADFMLKEAKR